jgi:hypothetical protein
MLLLRKAPLRYRLYFRSAFTSKVINGTVFISQIFNRCNKSTNPYIDANEYAPSFWEDDYCQIEIVPVENKAFILKQAKEIDRFAESSRTNYGYTETFERGTMPVQTLSKEIRADYLEQSLLGFQF